jgi:uncharacterized phage protein (predicted DNA packaging)
MDLLAKKITEIDLPFTKEYLKVDFPDDDRLLETLIVAARSYVQTILGFNVNDEWDTVEEIPAELTVACLMIIAHWYDQRQVQTVGTLGDEIKFAVTAILEAHKRPMKDYIDEEDGLTWNELEYYEL